MSSLKGRLEQLSSVTNCFRKRAKLALSSTRALENFASSCRPSGSTPSLSLPQPSDIATLLIDKGCSSTKAELISDDYLHSAKQFGDACRSTFRNACTKVTPSANSEEWSLRVQRLRTSLEERYNNKLANLKQIAISRAGEENAKGPQTVLHEESTVLLDNYFNFNAYPGVQERSKIATKTKMEEKQVEIWFQNRRARARKTGKPIRRLNADLLSSNERSTPRQPAEARSPPSSGSRETSPSSSEAGQSTPRLKNRRSPSLQANPLRDASAPQHAFPTVFAKSREHVQPRAPLNTTHYWLRKPTKTSPPRHALVDVETLCHDFANKLSFRALPSKKRSRESLESTSSWFSATVVTPSSAPHAALLRPLQPLNWNKPIPQHKSDMCTTRATNPRAFLAPCAVDPAVTMVSAAKPYAQATFFSERQIASLPQRATKSSPTLQHDQPPRGMINEPAEVVLHTSSLLPKRPRTDSYNAVLMLTSSDKNSDYFRVDEVLRAWSQYLPNLDQPRRSLLAC